MSRSGLPVHRLSGETFNLHGLSCYRVDWRDVVWNETLSSWLDDEEQQRIAQLQSARDKLRFGVTRVALKQLLAHPLPDHAAPLRLATNPTSVPRLSPAVPAWFSVSHGDGLSFIALSHHSPVGVDCERHDIQVDTEGVAAMVFTPAERAILQAWPDDERLRGFYRLWCHKEALLKCIGDGFSADPQQHCLGQLIGGQTPLYRLPGTRRQVAFFDVDAIPGHTAVICIEQPASRA